MTEFEKIALLYLAHNAKLLAHSLSMQDVVMRGHVAREYTILQQRIHATARDETMALLGMLPPERP